MPNCALSYTISLIQIFFMNVVSDSKVAKGTFFFLYT